MEKGYFEEVSNIFFMVFLRINSRRRSFPNLGKENETFSKAGESPALQGAGWREGGRVAGVRGGRAALARVRVQVERTAVAVGSRVRENAANPCSS